MLLWLEQNQVTDKIVKITWEKKKKKLAIANNSDVVLAHSRQKFKPISKIDSIWVALMVLILDSHCFLVLMVTVIEKYSIFKKAI